MGTSLARAAGGNGLSHRSPCHRSVHKDVQCIRTNWSATTEARFFLRLVQIGITTPEAAVSDIRMSPEQRDWMMSHFPEHRRLIEAVYRRRNETAETFKEMVRGNCA